jgi:Na+/proline symporter
MRFLLQLAPPISFFIVSAVTTFFSLAGLYAVRRKYSAEVLKENHEVAAIIFNAFGLFYGVLVAFVVFVTWSGYDEATKNLQLEASEALDIFHSAEAFPDPARKIIQQGLRDYITAVYSNEVPAMAGGDISVNFGGAHTDVRKLFDQMDVTSIPNRELYAESLRRLNNLAQYRRLRIFAGNDTNPPVIWLVLLVGGVFAVSYTFFFGMKNIRAQYLITTTLTVMITSILFLIYVLDHPFTGSSRVSLEPLRQAISVMQGNNPGE